MVTKGGVQRELAIKCYGEGRDIFDAFVLWLELRCLDQALMGRDGKKGYRSGQLPYLEAEFWLQDRGRNITRVEALVRGTDIFFQEVYRWPKPPLLRLRSFEKVCRHFNVIPVSGWREVPLAKFTNGKRHSAVRAVMALPAEDAPPWPRRYYKTAKSLHQALRKQDFQEGKGIPTGLQNLIIPQQVDADPLFQVSRADRLRPRAQEWRCLGV